MISLRFLFYIFFLAPSPPGKKVAPPALTLEERKAPEALRILCSHPGGAERIIMMGGGNWLLVALCFCSHAAALHQRFVVVLSNRAVCLTDRLHNKTIKHTLAHSQGNCEIIFSNSWHYRIYISEPRLFKKFSIMPPVLAISHGRRFTNGSVHLSSL